MLSANTVSINRAFWWKNITVQLKFIPIFSYRSHEHPLNCFVILIQKLVLHFILLVLKYKDYK